MHTHTQHTTHTHSHKRSQCSIFFGDMITNPPKHSYSHPHVHARAHSLPAEGCGRRPGEGVRVELGGARPIRGGANRATRRPSVAERQRRRQERQREKEQARRRGFDTLLSLSSVFFLVFWFFGFVFLFCIFFNFSLYSVISLLFLFDIHFFNTFCFSFRLPRGLRRNNCCS